MYGGGFFPTDHSSVYATGTSEVALAALHMGEFLGERPLRYAGLSTCFRRSAQSASRGRCHTGLGRATQRRSSPRAPASRSRLSWLRRT